MDIFERDEKFPERAAQKQLDETVVNVESGEWEDMFDFYEDAKGG